MVTQHSYCSIMVMMMIDGVDIGVDDGGDN